MPRGQLHERDPTLIQVLSLYLLLLAFFVILFNISKVEQFRTSVVTESLNSTFNDSGQTTETPVPLTSAQGRVIADHAFQRRIGQLIASLQSRLGVTSVVVTHDLQLCFAVSDRVGLLHEGRLVQVARPEVLRSEPVPEVREFLEGAALAAP